MEPRKYIRVDQMPDRQIFEVYAKEFARKAEESYDAYQSVGMQKFDNAYHKYKALAEALERDTQKEDLRQSISALTYQLGCLATSADNALQPDAEPATLVQLAKNVIAIAEMHHCYHREKGKNM